MLHIRSTVFIIFLLCIFFNGCIEDRETIFPTENTMTPGIFLEPVERKVLPPGVELRKVNERGIKLTKTSEGFRSGLYNDAAGYCTIAYGHLIKLAPCNGSEPEEFSNGVSEMEGANLLISDLELAEWKVMKLVRSNLNDEQFAALCDFTFNVGGENLRKSTLLKVVNAGQFERVPFQFRRWVQAGGKTLPGLKLRREKELALFFKGIGVPRAAPAPDEGLSPIDIRTGE